MSIRIMAVAGTTAGSKIIRWGVGEEASHLAVEFPRGEVIHSTLGGTRKMSAVEFHEHYRVVKECSFPDGKDVAMVQALMWAGLQDRAYDRPAFVFFAWRAFMRKFFSVPFPKRNYWESKDLYLCVEVILRLGDAQKTVDGAACFDSNQAWGMMTPEECVNLLSQPKGTA
jgi:hypothetical protein